MELVNKVSSRLAAMTPEEMMLLLVILCLLMVLMMGVSLLVLHRRTRRAEAQVQTLSNGVSEQLAAADVRSRESREQSQREMSEAMQPVNDSMMRMMGEMTRTQQG